jgi:hypothetical protein
MKQETKKPGKYERDAARVDAILAKGAENITAADRAELINIYNVSWHDTGKIEGAFSLDSSCNGCTFCQKMRDLAAGNDDIICGKCYDAKQEARWHSVMKRHALNLRIMSSVEFTIEELARLAGSGIVRVNSSGDFENEIHAGNMIKYAIGHSWARVGIWAKHCEVVEKAMDKYGKPGNVVYIASSLIINKRRALPKYADYTFTVYTADKIQEAIANGSMECNGKKCMACGWSCYYGTWLKGADIAEVLR